MKRTNSKRNSSSKSKKKISQSKSKSKAKVVKQAKKKPVQQEEEKKQIQQPPQVIIQQIQQQPAQDLRRIVYKVGEYLAVRNRQNIKLYDVVKVAVDFQHGDRTVSVLRFEADQINQIQRARSRLFVRDQLFQNAYNVDESEVVYSFIVKSKKKKINLDDPAKIKNGDLKKAHKALKANIKNIKVNEKMDKQRQKEEQAKEKEDKKLNKSNKVQVISKSKVKEEQKIVDKPLDRQQRANKRIKRGNDDEEEKQEQDDDLQQIDTGKKRDIKLKAKLAVIKKKEPEVQREDVQLISETRSKDSKEEELFLNCCQSCSNRNCIRAVNIGSQELMEKCINSKAFVTSIIEHQGPEMRFNALEKAISSNNLAIVEMMLSQDKPEVDSRMQKRAVQISKFDTGEVSKLAFGYKIRKVQMMRGNRQGNNAFLEDSVHNYQTPLEYLLESEMCMNTIFSEDKVEKETIKVIRESIGGEKFEKLIEKSIGNIMKHGCYQALVAIFEIKGINEDPKDSLFSKVFFELLTVSNLAAFTLTKQDLIHASLNTNYKPSHLAALNPSGLGLEFIRLQGEEIDQQANKISTIHYAAVCNSKKNLEFLIQNKIEVHEEDDKKKTPLIWAIESKKNIENIQVILDDLGYQFQKDAKDDQKKQAIHYLCQFGSPQPTLVLDVLLQHRAKTALAAGWDKYTPLEYASTYGQYDIVEYFLENIPRLNIDKGDKYKRTPLIMACRNGHTDIASLLIKHNANLNATDTSGNTALHHAAAYGWIECVSLLIRYGADPSPENAWKTTPIIIALQKNHLQIVKELLEIREDINVNSKDDEGRSILTLAIANINKETPEFVRLIIQDKKADCNTQDAKGRTPLYHLVNNMSTRKRGLFQFQDHDDLEHKILKLLLSSGADVNIKSKDQKSPFSLAFEFGMSDLLKLFGTNIDLNQDPSLFFAISGVGILRQKTHLMLQECMSQKRIEDETINTVSDKGFTPFLFYIQEFCLLQTQILCTIMNMIQKQQKQLTNENIINEHVKNVNNIMNPTKEAETIFKKEITEPFIAFLQNLIQTGANPSAYVLKLKQYRDFDTTQNQIQTQQSQSQSIAVLQGRRPPEKDQYVSEALGLNSSVHLVITYPNKDLFDYLMSIQGIELNQVNFEKMTPFFKLVKSKDIKQDPFSKYCFEKLLQTGQVDINAPDQFGNSAFWFMYTAKRYDEAMYLVDQGANINHMDNYGMFALKKELQANDIALMKRLLEKGANPDQKDEFGRTCLHLATDTSHKKDQKQVMALLMKFNSDISSLDFKQRSPLHYMFLRKNRRNQVDKFDPLINGLDLLINVDTKERIDINQQDINGKTLLHYAAQRGSVDSLNYLIKIFGVDVIAFDILDKWMNTPLAVAINCRHIQFIKALLELELVNMRGFIYDEPKIKAPNHQNQNQIGGGGLFANNNILGGGGLFAGGNIFGGNNNNQQILNQQEDELSDLEFMEVRKEDDNLNSGLKKHNKDQALNLFRYIIRNKIVELERLFIQFHYDKIQMVIDYICEGQISKLFEVIEEHFKNSQGAKESILIQKNKKEQNLIHVLARHAHLIKDIGDITKFFKQLVEEGVDPKELDYKGRSALHQAVLSGNIHFIKFLVEVEKFDLNQQDYDGANSITIFLKGDRILKANPKILEYLLSNKANPNLLYKESLYQESSQNKGEEEEEEEKKGDRQDNKQRGNGYQTTCTIHAIRHESKQRENIQEILKILLRYADMSMLDSEGRDCFMYIAMRNHTNTFNFILDTLKDKNREGSVIKNNVDFKNGKSFIHYIVNPLPFGSFENVDLLKKAIQFGFQSKIKDKQGNEPYYYAEQQKSGIMKKAFQEVGAKDIENNNQVVQDEEMNLQDLIQNNEVKLVDFEKDAQAYLQEIQMQIDPKNFVPCDAAGKFNEDCEVMFDEHTQQHFDAYLTRVEIGKFQPGGDYLFYRMQLVLDKSRDLPILLTRWGRIGEEGAFQKTPFADHKAAIEEYKKVFEQKTSNKWVHKDKFQKKFRKFQIMRTNYVTIDQKNYLVPFQMETAPQAKENGKDVLEVMREICDIKVYLKALQNSGVDPKAMPFSNLHRQNLYDAMEVLQKLEKVLEKLENMNPRPYGENERNTLLSLREKMWYLSSRFYESIPHEEFRNKMVPPISTLNLLATKSQMLQSLIEIEMASKILLGACYKQEEINPLEYCLWAAGVQIQVLDSKTSEFNLLQDYVLNTNGENKNRHIQRIFRLEKPSDNIKFTHNLKNRFLFFHGSRISNFLSILSQGLKVQPVQVKKQGNLLGKGIYFTDMFQKSFQYTNDQSASYSSKFVLICEVALGETKELSRFSNNYVIEEGFQSVQGCGRTGPEASKYVTLTDGAKIPIGKVSNYANRAASEFQYNEFVVKNPEQVRFRYLVQIK